MVMVKSINENHSFQCGHGHHGHNHLRGHGHLHGHGRHSHTLKSLPRKYRHPGVSAAGSTGTPRKAGRSSLSRQRHIGEELDKTFKIHDTKENDNDSVFVKDDFSLGTLLGSGGFGTVYMANSRQGETSLVIKVMKNPTLSKNPDAMYESFNAELQCMNLSHPNIVQYLGATMMTSFDEEAWVFMEYAGSRTLQTVLDEPEIVMTIELRLQHASQIAFGLKYLHDNNVVHLDIKPANIIISADGVCKIGDLGCSQILEHGSGSGRISPTQRSALTGTFAYRAPELLRGEAPTRKADIYSFGITLWQMLYRNSPYGNENQHVVIFGVVAYGNRPKCPDMNEDNPFEWCYRDLYSQCWDSRSDNRPSASELVEVLDIWTDNF